MVTGRGVVQLTNPTDGSEVTKDNLSIAWTDIGGATGYAVRILPTRIEGRLSDKDMAVVGIKWCAGSSCKLSVDTSAWEKGWYEAQVVPFDRFGTLGPWSEPVRLYLGKSLK